MSRVTSIQVKEIIDTGIEDVTAFITPANLIVTDRLSDKGMSKEQLAEIEKWLAAHFVCMKDPRVKEEKIGDASDKFEGRNTTGLGLDSTSYGQQVKLIDTSNTLHKLGKKKASVQVIG